MKAIVEYTKEEYAVMLNKSHELYEAISGTPRDRLITFTKRGGYAHYTYRGTYTDRLVELLGRDPDTDEIIMLVDGGFSHFGATCTIDAKTKAFSGRVNID